MIDSSYAANPTSVGILIHIESPEQGISWSGSVGYADKGRTVRIESDQPALIASNFKTFVSASILLLIEKDLLSIEQPINGLLSDKTSTLFDQGGYSLKTITIKHLLSHTSGIQNYANETYIAFIDANKSYRWTRDEQLELTVETGPPLAPPGSTFNYSDANYLLLTEIMEQITGIPFFEAMRQMLQYDSMGLHTTWMPTLEEMPTGTKPLVHQYWEARGWDSYDIDVSVDLYGGGGLACSSSDLARFINQLFSYEIVKDTAIFNLIFSEIRTRDPRPSHYYLGISSSEYGGSPAFGHGGFWGTAAYFVPELQASLAVYVLEKDQKWLIGEILDRCVAILKD